nr:uncharacterized protein LOC111510185 [Leptinotarsa decemlineata]
MPDTWRQNAMAGEDWFSGFMKRNPKLSIRCAQATSLSRATSFNVTKKTHSNEKQIQLSELDFSASGSYSCVVSMDTPIYMKDSDSKDLTVIEPQEGPPEITFNKSTYEIGEVLEANCTTTPAKPPPHITWLINNEKVSDKLTKSFSNGLIHGHGYFDQKAFSIKQLSIEVSDLHLGEDGQLTLTCQSTIPGYVNAMENYADFRSATKEKAKKHFSQKSINKFVMSSSEIVEVARDQRFDIRAGLNHPDAPDEIEIKLYMIA